MLQVLQRWSMTVEPTTSDQSKTHEKWHGPIRKHASQLGHEHDKVGWAEPWSCATTLETLCCEPWSCDYIRTTSSCLCNHTRNTCNLDVG